MTINIDEMPESKKFDDYPENTEFVHREHFPRYDRKVLKENRLVRVYFGDPGYDEAATIEEIKSIS